MRNAWRAEAQAVAAGATRVQFPQVAGSTVHNR